LFVGVSEKIKKGKNRHFQLDRWEMKDSDDIEKNIDCASFHAQI